MFFSEEGGRIEIDYVGTFLPKGLKSGISDILSNEMRHSSLEMTTIHRWLNLETGPASLYI